MRDHTIIKQREVMNLSMNEWGCIRIRGRKQKGEAIYLVSKKIKIFFKRQQLVRLLTSSSNSSHL